MADDYKIGCPTFGNVWRTFLRIVEGQIFNVSDSMNATLTATDGFKAIQVERIQDGESVQNIKIVALGYLDESIIPVQSIVLMQDVIGGLTSITDSAIPSYRDIGFQFAAWQTWVWQTKLAIIEEWTDGSVLNEHSALRESLDNRMGIGLGSMVVANDFNVWNWWEQMEVFNVRVEGSDWRAYYDASSPPVGNGRGIAIGPGNAALTTAVQSLANTSVDVSFNNGATKFSVLGGTRIESGQT